MHVKWNLTEGLTWKKLAGRVWRRISDDNVLGCSAQLSYYFLLTLFPLLLFLTTLLGLFAGDGTELRNSLLSYLSAVMPPSASELIHNTVDEISAAAGGGKLSIGIVATLWAASNGMSAISDSLNVAYNVRESRPWWKKRLVAVALTIALAILIISALTFMFFGSAIAEKVAISLGLGGTFTFSWKILQWPLALAFVLLGFSLIYYFAPDLPNKNWKWVTPGSLVGLTIWLLVSFGFRGYLHFFNAYSATYGSLGAVIIMMLWFYFSGAAILIGGEINSVLENGSHATQRSEQITREKS